MRSLHCGNHPVVRTARLARACCEVMESRRLLSTGPGAIVTEGDQFGLVDGQNLILAQTDIDGDTVFYRLTGGGTGTVADGALQLTGTTNTSALAVIVRRGSGGDGLATLSGITADGPMRSISAAAVTVAGDITLNGGAAPRRHPREQLASG